MITEKDLECEMEELRLEIKENAERIDKLCDILKRNNEKLRTLKQQRNLMKFSDLPDNSWEKEMFRVIDFIGGDAPALCNWNDEIPTPQKVAESILTLIAYGDNRDPEKFIHLFNEYRQQNRYFPESDFEKVEE